MSVVLGALWKKITLGFLANWFPESLQKIRPEVYNSPHKALCVTSLESLLKQVYIFRSCEKQAVIEKVKRIRKTKLRQPC